jgi:hypothetical protein
MFRVFRNVSKRNKPKRNSVVHIIPSRSEQTTTSFAASRLQLTLTHKFILGVVTMGLAGSQFCVFRAEGILNEAQKSLVEAEKQLDKCTLLLQATEKLTVSVKPI